MSPTLAGKFPSTAPPKKSLSSYIYFEYCGHIYIKKAERQRTDAFDGAEKTLENPLDSKEIKPVNPKENQP